MMSAPSRSCPSLSGGYHRRLHALAVVSACAVFPLVLVGASVTSKEAGMAYPDGFTSNGYLIQNPPGWWDQDDTRWEHGHRLLGRAVGLLSIALAIGCWRRGGVLRVVGLCNLVAIIIQGTLGAFRVYEVSTLLAMVHGIFGQMCFCLTCCVALITGRTWSEGRGAIAVRSLIFLRRLCLLGVMCVALQLVSGAALRHFGHSTMVIVHIFGAMLVTFLVGWIAMWIMGQHPGRHLLSRLGLGIAVLLVVQLLLGAAAFTITVIEVPASVLVQWAVPSAHVGVGALIFVAMVLVMLCSYGMLRSADEETSASESGSLSTA